MTTALSSFSEEGNLKRDLINSGASEEGKCNTAAIGEGIESDDKWPLGGGQQR